jgi:hypothetical protein
MTQPNLGTLAIDLPRLLETRLLVQAASSGGKSWCLRKVLEETAPLVQQLVIDSEGEFSTLRERFDYIVCAPHGADAVANPQTAAALARALWKAGTSAVLDIYDLKKHERVLFVRRFVEALVSAPRSMWHSTLVVIDEAHDYAPQVGSAESGGAVIDLATRGRKRGLALVAATQRLSKLHKDVAAETLNKLVGLTSLDVDVQRAADELGMSKKDATEALRALNPGEFYAYGPALSRVVTRTKIGMVQTTHPQIGHRELTAPPPASPKVIAALAKLEGVQREVEAEARTVDELKAEVATLRRKITMGAIPGADEAEIQRRVRVTVEDARAAGKAEGYKAALTFVAAEFDLSETITATAQVLAKLHGLSNVLALAEPPAATPTPAPARSPAAAPPRKPAAHVLAHHKNGVTATAAAMAIDMTGPEQRILDAIAWLEVIGVAEPEQPAVAFLADYTYGAGSYNNARGRLNQRGFVRYVPGGKIALTDAGRAVANMPDSPGSNAELHERVLAKLDGPAGRLLVPLLHSYPQPMDNAALAAASGYTAGAGSFNNARGRLRTLGLIDYPRPGACAALPLLFPRSV